MVNYRDVFIIEKGIQISYSKVPRLSFGFCTVVQLLCWFFAFSFFYKKMRKQRKLLFSILPLYVAVVGRKKWIKTNSKALKWISMFCIWTSASRKKISFTSALSLIKSDHMTFQRFSSNKCVLKRLLFYKLFFFCSFLTMLTNQNDMQRACRCKEQLDDKRSTSQCLKCTFDIFT